MKQKTNGFFLWVGLFLFLLLFATAGNAQVKGSGIQYFETVADMEAFVPGEYGSENAIVRSEGILSSEYTYDYEKQKWISAGDSQSYINTCPLSYFSSILDSEQAFTLNHCGDSNTENELRKVAALRQKFIDKGYYRSVNGYMSLDKSTRTGTWDIQDISASSVIENNSANGLELHSNTVNSTLSIQTNCTGIALFTKNTGSVFRYRIDNGTWITINTLSDNTLNVVEVENLTFASHNIFVELISGDFIGYGVYFSDSRPGKQIVYNNLGNSGSSSNDFQTKTSDNYDEIIDYISADITLIDFGTNDKTFGITPSKYAENLGFLISRHRLVSNTDIMIISSANNENSDLYTMDLYNRQAAWVASSTKSQFLSLFDFWTGFEGESPFFVDAVHFSTEGGDKNGDLYYKALSDCTLNSSSLSIETDPVFDSHVSKTITQQNISLWNQEFWREIAGSTDYSKIYNNGLGQVYIGTTVGNETLNVGETIGFASVSGMAPVGVRGFRWAAGENWYFGREPLATWTAPDYARLVWRSSTGMLIDPGTAFGKSYVDIVGGGLRVTQGNTHIGSATAASEKLQVTGNAKIVGNLYVNATGAEDINTNTVGFSTFSGMALDGFRGLKWAASGWQLGREDLPWVAPNYSRLYWQSNTGLLLNPGTAFGKSYVDIVGGGLRVTQGNTHIGSATAASEKLQVTGNMRLTGDYYDSNNNAGLEGQILGKKTGGGTAWRNETVIKLPPDTLLIPQLHQYDIDDVFTGTNTSVNGRQKYTTDSIHIGYKIHRINIVFDTASDEPITVDLYKNALLAGPLGTIPANQKKTSFIVNTTMALDDAFYPRLLRSGTASNPKGWQVEYIISEQ